MSHSGNWDILKDQVWFYSCELLDWNFHSVVFKQCQKEQLKPLAWPHLILNCQVILVLEGSSNISLSSVKNTVPCSQWIIVAWWPVLWNIIPGCLCGQSSAPSSTAAPQSQQGVQGLSVIQDYWFQGMAQSCQSAFSRSISVQPTQPFPPSEKFFGFLVENAYKTLGQYWLLKLWQDSWMKPRLFALDCIKFLYQKSTFHWKWLTFSCDLFSNNTFNVLNENLNPLHNIDEYIAIFSLFPTFFSLPHPFQIFPDSKTHNEKDKSKN